MKEPVLEDDVVERLQRIDEEAMYRMPATTFTAVQDAIRTIERLQKELGEAESKAADWYALQNIISQLRFTEKSLREDNADLSARVNRLADVRQQTIEDCAEKIPEFYKAWWAQAGGNDSELCDEYIAKAIRSMDGGGK